MERCGANTKRGAVGDGGAQHVDPVEGGLALDLLVLAVEAEALVGDFELEVLAHPEAVPDRAGGQPDLVAAA